MPFILHRCFTVVRMIINYDIILKVILTFNIHITIKFQNIFIIYVFVKCMIIHRENLTKMILVIKYPTITLIFILL